MNREQRLCAALTNAFAPLSLEVIDDSAQHAGHAGATAGGETHYTVRMTASAFAGLSRVARSRLVHEALKDEFESGLHALALSLKSPAERGDG